MSTTELGIDFQMPKNQSSQIKVMGIGGGGSNAVNYMFENGIKGVDFVICNTDSQALEASAVPIKIQLGINLTEGLGAGSNPDVGRQAAEESSDRITELLDANTKMLFVTAGMGGGTGTGAAPVIAEIAKEKGILTVGVVTVPFKTEGGFRRKYADEGINELRKYVDTLLVINNEKLIEVYGDLTFTAAFAKANEVLNTATKGIAEVISQHLLVNIDLNDARKVLENSGTAVMGQAQVEGENRAIEAVIGALDSPLLNDNDITGAKQVLLKIVTGDGDGEIKMSELSKIKNKIQEAAGMNVNIIEGIGIDSSLGMAISVTVIATGFEEKRKPQPPVTLPLGSAKDYDDEPVTNEPKSSDIKNNEDKKSQQQELDLDQIEINLDDSNLGVEIENKIENKKSIDLLSKNLDEVKCDSNLNELTTNKIVLELEDNVEEIVETNSKIVLELEDNVEENVKSISQESENFLVDSINEQNIDNLEEDNNQKINSTELDKETIKIESREREERLRNISMQLRTPSGLSSLEDIPAYKRNNIDLTENSNSNEEVSTFTLSNEEKTELKENNSFLHDNVD